MRRSFFHTLGIAPSMGRGFVQNLDGADSGFEALISHRLWTSEFGQDSSILGRTIQLDGQTLAVVGVLPPDFDFLHDETEIWLPMAPDRADQESHVLRGLGRLRPGVTSEAARAELQQILEAAGSFHFYRSPYLGDRKVSMQAGLSLLGDHVQDINLGLAAQLKPKLGLLFAVVVLVLLIAACNVANLQLGRGLTRQREFAVRSAMGASRGRLVRLVLAESLLLGLSGGALAVLFGAIAVRLLSATPSLDLERFELGTELPVLAFTGLLSLGAAFLVGILPALTCTRPNLNWILQSGATASLRRVSHLLHQGVVVVELGLGLTLLIGGSLLVQSLSRLVRVDPGFVVANLGVLELDLPRAGYADPSNPDRLGPALTRLETELLDRIRALPGVRSAALTNSITQDPGVVPFTIDGYLDPPNRPSRGLTFQPVTEDFFDTMGIRLFRGRGFEPQDGLSGSRVAIINRQAAALLWPDGQSRRTIRFQGTLAGPREVIGVVEDSRHLRLDGPPWKAVYIPYSELPMSFPLGRLRLSFNLIFRTERDPHSFFPAVRRILASLEPSQPATLRSMEEVLSEQLAERRLYASMLVVFSTAALFLAAIGVFGVISLMVARRTPEIGIRLTLGASRGNVALLVLRRVVLLAVAGLGIGIAAGSQLTRLLEGLLFGITTSDPLSHLVAVLILFGVCLGASLGPLLRATGVDPAASLRAL